MSNLSLKLISLKLVTLFTCCAFLSACSSLEEADKSTLSHPGMDLKARVAPSTSSYLTTLGSIQQTSSGGACTTCAH